MNKSQAYNAGYTFTGHFSWDKDEMKVKAAGLRKLGNQAIVVGVPPDKLNRGHHGTGYSVMWIESETNAIVRKQKEREDKRSQLVAERDRFLMLAAEANEKLSEFDKGDGVMTRPGGHITGMVR